MKPRSFRAECFEEGADCIGRTEKGENSCQYYDLIGGGMLPAMTDLPHGGMD